LGKMWNWSQWLSSINRHLRSHNVHRQNTNYCKCNWIEFHWHFVAGKSRKWWKLWKVQNFYEMKGVILV
jgi:hypothetical protein